jgi:hypothetical protein
VSGPVAEAHVGQRLRRLGCRTVAIASGCHEL